MDQLVLRRTVEIEGRDIQGRKTLLVISPNNEQTGWVWKVNDSLIPITPEIMFSRPRRVTLEYGGYRLNEFEHIGILRAAGLSHVKIWTPGVKSWPPFDGGSHALWQAIKPHVYKSGQLLPYRFMRHGLHSYQLQREVGRSISYYYDTNDKKILLMTGVVDFPSLRKEVYRFSFEYPRDDLNTLLSARTLGWPPYLQPVARAASKSGRLLKLFGREWPHYDRILWPYQTAVEETLSEIGRHRMLDALGVLNFLAPTGTYLTGAIHSLKGNHEADIGLLKQLYGPNVVAFRKNIA